MGLIGRQTIKSTIYIYLGVVLGFFIRAHFFPTYLSESEIGVLALLISYGSIFAQIAMLGFNHAAIRYFPYFQNQEKGHGGFLSLYLLVIIFGFLCSLVIYKLVEILVISPNATDLFYHFYYLCIPLTVGLLIFMAMDNYNTVLYNASTGVLLREFGLRVLTLLALVPFIYQLISFEQFAQIYVGTYSIVALLMAAFIVWRGEFHLSLNLRAIERSMLRAMAGISAFGFITGFTMVAIIQVNNIMIDWYYDEALTGIFVINFFFATLILMPSRGLNKIAPALISGAFKNDDIDAIRNIHFKSTINQLLIGLLLFIGLCINLDNIYQILPESYEVGKWVIIIIGIANLIQMIGGVSSAIIGFSSYYKYNTFLSIIQLALLIGLNIVFLPAWGITGAAIATLCVMFVLNVAKYLIIKRKFNIQPYRKNHLIPLIIGVICIGINEVIPAQQHFVVDIILRSSLITIVYVGANYFLGTSDQLNATINNTLVRLRIR